MFMYTILCAFACLFIIFSQNQSLQTTPLSAHRRHHACCRQLTLWMLADGIVSDSQATPCVLRTTVSLQRLLAVTTDVYFRGHNSLSTAHERVLPYSHVMLVLTKTTVQQLKLFVFWSRTRLYSLMRKLLGLRYTAIKIYYYSALVASIFRGWGTVVLRNKVNLLYKCQQIMLG